MFRKNVFRVTPDSGVPLIGCIAFGIIDRGTNLVQVRPISGCNLNCIFCSVDEGPYSRTRVTRYLVDLDYLLEYCGWIAEFKGHRKLEFHIDCAGDPVTYPYLVELVQGLSEIRGVEVVSMQTHGVGLTEKLVDELADAGLSRINLSIDALNPDLARKLAGLNSYRVDRVLELAEYIVANEKIDLLVAPVWVPGYNDAEIEPIIRWALKIGAGGRWPPLGIQKYVPHKHGRKPPGCKPMTWGEFYSKLRRLEKRYGVKLVLSPSDFGIHRRKMVPVVFEKGERVTVKVVAPGWVVGEKIGVCKGRCITIVDASQVEIGAKIKVTVIENKHNIYIGKVE